jgi:hypothetical protein
MQLGYFQVMADSGLDLRPGNPGAAAAAVAVLGDEVVNSALAVLVS